MTESEHATALAHAIEGTEDACLGPTDIALVVKALHALAEAGVSAANPSDLAETTTAGLIRY